MEMSDDSKFVISTVSSEGVDPVPSTTVPATANEAKKMSPPGRNKNWWSVVFLLIVATVASGVLFYLQRNSDDVFLQNTESLFVSPEPIATPNATQCLRIKWYRVTGDITLPTSWLELTDVDIKELRPAEVIYISIMGKPVEGGRVYNRARIRAIEGGIAQPFQLNDVTALVKPKITPKDPDEFYVLYTIPASPGPKTITFDGQVYSPQRDTNTNPLDGDGGWE